MESADLEDEALLHNSANVLHCTAKTRVPGNRIFMEHVTAGARRESANRRGKAYLEEEVTCRCGEARIAERDSGKGRTR